MQAAEHRRALERLAAEYAEVMRRRHEFGELRSALIIAAQVKAMATRLESLGYPAPKVREMLHEADALVTDVLGVKATLARLLNDFDALAAVDPAFCQKVLSQFAETGRFLVAARKTNAPTSTRRH